MAVGEGDGDACACHIYRYDMNAMRLSDKKSVDWCFCVIRGFVGLCDRSRQCRVRLRC